MSWLPLFPLAELPRGSMRARKGVLVAHLGDGGLFAVDNACPHQGYPLATGTLRGCTLTCAWHNFKFDVRDGSCLMGEEAVRTHGVRVVDGMVEVEPNTAIDLDASRQSLDAAMQRHQMSRAAREVTRMLQCGTGAPALLAWGAAWDADRGEYGPGHTAALAADLLRWLPTGEEDADEGDGIDRELQLRTQVVTEGLDLASETVLGLSPRNRPPPELPPSDPDAAAVELRARVEREDAPGAEALVRGLVASGADRATLERALYPLVADHFLDFGHLLIYVRKTLDLLDAAGPEHADSLLGGLVYGIVNATREDLLPPWAGFRARWKAWEATGSLAPAGGAAMQHATRDAANEAHVAQAVAHGSPAEAFDAVAAALAEARWEDAVGGISRAAAVRLLRFDARHDTDPTVEEGWLDVTHRLTVANATRHAVARCTPRDAARIALMAAQFVNLARPLDRPAEEADDSASDAPDQRRMRSRVLHGRRHRPIFFAHDVKTLVAAEEEAAALGDPLPLRAVERYLAHPVQERVIERFAHQAVRLVRDGKPPRSLTG